MRKGVSGGCSMPWFRLASTILNEDGGTVTSADFSFEKHHKYFRITVIGKDGKTACTNAYFADDIFE